MENFHGTWCLTQGDASHCMHLFNAKAEEPQGLHDHWGWMNLGSLDVKRGAGSKIRVHFLVLPDLANSTKLGPCEMPPHFWWEKCLFCHADRKQTVKGRGLTQTGNLPESRWWVQCHTRKCFFTIFAHFIYQPCKHIWSLKHW